MIHFFYRNREGDEVELTANVNLRFGENPQAMTMNAEERSVGTWECVLEDLDGTFVIDGLRLFYVREDDATNEDIFVGYTAERHSNRGQFFRTEAERQIQITLTDINTLFERRIITDDDDGNRPEETDVERMQWLFDAGMFNIVDDTYLSTANPVDMDAADYRGRMVSEVVEDCMGQSGKNSFMFHDGISHLFYGDSSANTDVLTSDLRITNYLPDVDNVTTWEAHLSDDWEETPSRVFSDLWANYDGGAVFNRNTDTSDQFARRATVVSWPDVKTAAKANARSIRYLDTINTEEHIIKATIEVPPANVNDAFAGQRIQCLFTHFPPYAASYTWMRILERAVTWVSPERYRIEYTLSPGRPTLSCSDTIGTIEGWVEGAHVDVFDQPPVPFDPLPTIPDYPAIVIGFWACLSTAEPMWRLTQTATVSGFTEWGNSRDGWIGDNASLAMAGYKAIASGDAGTMSVSWGGSTGTGAQSWNALGCAFATSATAPVHTGWQNNNGDTATLDGTPTPGNLLVICRFVEQGAPGGFSQDPIGATGVTGGSFVSGIANAQIDIWVRCVEEGDTADIQIGDASFSHWAFVSEWEIT